MKNIQTLIVCMGLCFSIGCQKAAYETVEKLEDDGCQDAFENTNNQLANAPTLSHGDWIGLPQNDIDHWKMYIAAHKNGQMPTKIRYTLLYPTYVSIIVWQADTVLVGPKVTMTFKDNLSDFIELPPLKTGDAVVVQMRQVAQKSTCYQLEME